MKMAEEIQKRQVAKKIKISDVLSGSYIKEDGWNPNFIEVDEKRISRANIIGAVLEKEEGNDLNYISIMLDDGSGNISGRVFKDDMYKLKDINIGDIILVIARPREYGNERYLLIEIAKKIENKKWIEVRKLELEKNKDNVKKIVKKTEDIEEKSKGSREEVVEEDVVKEEKEMSAGDKVIDFVREKDGGEGIDVQAIVDEFKDEKIVKDLLSEGELFEIKPGRIKVLE